MSAALVVMCPLFTHSAWVRVCGGGSVGACAYVDVSVGVVCLGMLHERVGWLWITTALGVGQCSLLSYTSTDTPQHTKNLYLWTIL